MLSYSTIRAAIRPPSVETAELLYVDTREKLLLAITELSAHPVIGIDVEAHAFRYYFEHCNQHFAPAPAKKSGSGSTLLEFNLGLTVLERL